MEVFLVTIGLSGFVASFVISSYCSFSYTCISSKLF